MALLLLFVLTLYANFREMNKLDDAIAALGDRIERQELYAPLFQELFTSLQMKMPDGLVSFKPAKLDSGDTERLLSEIRRMARKQKLTVKNVVPDIESSIDGSDYMMVSANVQGEFLSCDRFYWI